MLTLDSMSPEMHRRIEFSLSAIREEVSHCRDLHAQFLADLSDYGVGDYGTVLKASTLAEPMESPVFRARVRQQLACLQRLAVGVERHAIDYDTLAAAEGLYLCQQTWRWHVFIELRRRTRTGFEESHTALQRVAGRIAADRMRTLTSSDGDAREYWGAIASWGQGDGSPHVAEIAA